jgi:hypothetical protein
MQGMGAGDCPFEFNFDASTFKVGDTVAIVSSAVRCSRTCLSPANCWKCTKIMW